jgi:hypothetical protein
MMTVNQVWLALVLVVLHTVQLVLVLKPSCANIMKFIRNLYSFHLEKNSRVLSVLSVVRNCQTELWFQASLKDTFTQSTHIYARNHSNILKDL